MRRPLLLRRASRRDGWGTIVLIGRGSLVSQVVGNRGLGPGGLGLCISRIAFLALGVLLLGLWGVCLLSSLLSCTQGATSTRSGIIVIGLGVLIEVA